MRLLSIHRGNLPSTADKAPTVQQVPERTDAAVTAQHAPYLRFLWCRRIRVVAGAPLFHGYRLAAPAPADGCRAGRAAAACRGAVPRIAAPGTLRRLLLSLLLFLRLPRPYH